MAAPRQGRSCCRLAKIARSPLQGRYPITPRSALDIYVRVPAQVYARSIPSADFRVFPSCSGDRETNLMCLASPTFSLTSLTQANLFRRVRIADARCFPLPVGFIVVSYFQSATVGCIGCILVVLLLLFSTACSSPDACVGPYPARMPAPDTFSYFGYFSHFKLFEDVSVLRRN